MTARSLLYSSPLPIVVPCSLFQRATQSQVVACCHPLILGGFSGLEGLTRNPAAASLGQQPVSPVQHVYQLVSGEIAGTLTTD